MSQITIVITWDNGQVGIRGPDMDLVGYMGILEVAKDAIRQKFLGDKSSIELVPPIQGLKS